MTQLDSAPAPGSPALAPGIPGSHGNPRTHGLLSVGFTPDAQRLLTPLTTEEVQRALAGLPGKA